MTSRPSLRSGRVALAASAAVALTLVTACGPAATRDDVTDYPDQTLELLVPAATGGGWDLTARTLQRVIGEADLSGETVQVINREGGGGATGLAELTSRGEGDPYQLMIGGLVMIGALEQANSPLQITDATAVATLTSEAEAFVVRDDSPYRSIEDVVEAYTDDPSSVTFGGGSVGGSDHIAVGLMLQAAEQTPSDMTYIGYSGGGEATAGILSGDVAVGVSGVSEFEGQLASGDMRLLAITSTEEIEIAGETAPTLADAGLDVDFVNWRALFAPPGLSDEEIAAVEDFVDRVHDSGEWADAIEQQGWTDDYRSGQDARDFIEEQQASTAEILGELGL